MTLIFANRDKAIIELATMIFSFEKIMSEFCPLFLAENCDNIQNSPAYLLECLLLPAYLQFIAFDVRVRQRFNSNEFLWVLLFYSDNFGRIQNNV